MSEMDKLEQYLDDHGYSYHRFNRAEQGEEFKQLLSSLYDKTVNDVLGEQINVFDNNGMLIWDVICGYGSYGCEDGLLEGMGCIFCGDENDVIGCLTAEDVIDRLEKDKIEKQKTITSKDVLHWLEEHEESSAMYKLFGEMDIDGVFNSWSFNDIYKKITDYYKDENKCSTD